mgnify:CR=1 FL=1
MKVIHSSIFRAVCAIIVGVLLIQYREQTVTWITIAIGVLFFLSGVISLASYWAAKRNAEKMQGQILSDSNGKPIMGMIPKFPLVSVGSLILGLLLALMPQVFIAWLMFILAFILILGALTQFANLASAAKMGRVGILFWLFPSALLLLGLLAIIKPSAIASAPLFIIGWGMLIYGVVELLNAFKVSNNKRIWLKNQQQKQKHQSFSCCPFNNYLKSAKNRHCIQSATYNACLFTFPYFCKNQAGNPCRQKVQKDCIQSITCKPASCSIPSAEPGNGGKNAD